MEDSEDVKYRKFRDEGDSRTTTSGRENGETSTRILDEDSHTFGSHENTLSHSNDIEDTVDDRELLLTTSEYTGGCGFFCNPQSICHKGIALALMCSVGFGSYFCYDNPGALQVNQT